MKHNTSVSISKNSLRLPIHIYGSGISGLVTAYNFYKLGFLDINIHTRGRGVIQSLLTEDGVVELAANSILQNTEVTNLLNEFEIEYEYYSSLGKKKYIFFGEKAVRWPLSFLETFKSVPSLIKLSLKSQKMRPKEFETIDEWSKRTIGSLLSERLFKIGLKGIYGPNTGDLSASLCLSSLFEKREEASKGSISFKKGMGSFIKVLENELSLSGVKFHNIDKDEVQNQKNGISVICTPAHSVPSFIKNDFSKIDYHSISIVTYIHKEEDRLPFKGFGCLFDDNEEGVLGVILNSDLFDNRALKGSISETWILKGDIYKDEYSLGPVEKFRSDKFKVSSSYSQRYFKHWDKAFPVYSIALERSLKDIKKESNIYFFGNWTGRIGIGRLIEESPKFVREILRDMSNKR